ncbi:flavin reductase family protein [Natronorubrum thiooxidans]|uniref:NADH-FMN oxidoreductase RutF, flavin reductase (DIM6/NTAB) family n=1 Tax=Natronorubrum thiooxidans TaxID=308853 RepID=A0A1N7C6S2_9EURY|nr:flavin reductase [Natronorubrum thiooxidans]SIR59270.1 NADH-FMN oxidoreductase RutF, flavin reductase (DIM6/NTAB) family [Natronorubrum thiooxidans]
MSLSNNPDLITLQPEQSFFETLYTAAPLVIVGTRDEDGSENLAPKHMAMPLGWANQFGFVCTPEHGTYRNVERTGAFTVSYPRPEDILDASLAAAPRGAEGDKPSLTEIDTVDADAVDAPAVAGAYGVLECDLERIVAFDDGELITGSVVEKHVHTDAYRSDDAEPETLLEQAPVLAHLYPDRFAAVSESQAFPFPEGFER